MYAIYMSPRTHFGNTRMNAWRVDVIDGNTPRRCSRWQLLILLSLYCALCLLRHHWHWEETVWVGNLITSARWTENDHCECNKAAVKTSQGSLRCFELEKCQVKSPPVCVTQSLAQSFCSPCRHSSYTWENYLVTFKNILVSNTLRPKCQLHFSEFNWRWLSLILIYFFVCIFGGLTHETQWIALFCFFFSSEKK